jgi:hypothetical protein
MNASARPVPAKARTAPVRLGERPDVAKLLKRLLKRPPAERLEFLASLAWHLHGPAGEAVDRNGFSAIVRSLPAGLRRKAQPLFTEIRALAAQRYRVSAGLGGLAREAKSGK